MFGKKIFKGIAVDIFGTAIMVCVSFSVIPLYLEYLSPKEYGLWLSISAIAALIGALDIATDQYLTTAAANTELFESVEFSERLFLVLTVKCINVFFLLIVGITVFSLLDFVIQFDEDLAISAKAAFVLAFFTLCIITFCNSIPTILLARRHFSLVNATSSITTICSSFFAICLLELGFRLASLPMSIAFFAALQYTYLFLKLRVYYPKLCISMHPINKVFIKDILKYSLSFHLVRSVYGIFRTQYILVAINTFLGPTFVASFSVTNRLPSAISANSMKLAIPFFPSLADLFAKGDLIAVRDIFFKINKVLIRLAFFSAIVLHFANQKFVGLWVGDHLFGGKYIMAWLLMYLLLYISMGAFGIIVFSSKRFGAWPFWLFVEMLMTIALSIFLAHDFGLTGVVASFVAGASISQIYLFNLVKKELGFGFGEYINSIGFYAVSPNAITLLGALIFDHYIVIEGWNSLSAFVGVVIVLQLASREGMRLILSKEDGFSRRLIWAFSL